MTAQYSIQNRILGYKQAIIVRNEADRELAKKLFKNYLIFTI